MSEEVYDALCAHHNALCELDHTNDEHTQKIIDILQQLPNYKVTGEIIHRSRINSKLNELGRSMNPAIKAQSKAAVKSFKTQLTLNPAPQDHQIVQLNKGSEGNLVSAATAEAAPLSQPVLAETASSGMKRKLDVNSNTGGDATEEATTTTITSTVATVTTSGDHGTTSAITATSTSTTNTITNNTTGGMATATTVTSSITVTAPSTFESNSNKTYALGKTGAPDRDRIQKVFYDCIKNHCGVDEQYATELAVLIESALFDHFGVTRRSEYTTQARTIMSNLKDPNNPDFKLRLSTGAIQPDELPEMPVHEMASEKSKQERLNLIQYELESRKTDLDGGSTGVDMFPCPKCHAKKTSFYQKQTRSADEPMTIFCRCMVCNHRWRIY